MTNWTVGRITAADAEREPEHERLFERPLRRPSRETVQLIEQAKRRLTANLQEQAHDASVTTIRRQP